MRILVTGGTGLLGINWASELRYQHEVMLGTHRRTVHLKGTRAVPIHLSSVSALEQTLKTIKPDIVVHTAGLSSVDDCERAPDKAIEINATLAENVALATKAMGARLVHISTDHLFDGEKSMYSESDPTTPLNAYARSKLEGERRVASAFPEALIVRTNFFGWGHASRQSITDWILQGLRGGKDLHMFTDVFFSPIHAGLLARTVHELLDTGATGLYHVAGRERVSKYAFALHLAQMFGLSNLAIHPKRFSDAGLAAPRPLDMSLACDRSTARLQHPMPSLDEMFNYLKTQELAGLGQELQSAVMEPQCQ